MFAIINLALLSISPAFAAPVGDCFDFVDSKIPWAPPQLVSNDAELNGCWKLDSSDYHVATLRIKIQPQAKGGQSLVPSPTPERLKKLQVFCGVPEKCSLTPFKISGRSFYSYSCPSSYLNPNHLRYQLFRYEVSSNQLTLWKLRQEAVIAAINAGELTGNIAQTFHGGYVSLEEDSKPLEKFLRSIANSDSAFKQAATITKVPADEPCFLEIPK